MQDITWGWNKQFVPLGTPSHWVNILGSQIKPKVACWIGLVTFVTQLNSVVLNLYHSCHPKRYICIINDIYAAIDHFHLHANMNTL